MSVPLRSTAIFVVALLLAVPAIERAQTAGGPGSPDQNPADVKFEVRTANGKTEFQVGEVIPLELAFSSTSPKKYSLNMASYDRSGRMGYEGFSVQPEGGWHDPLETYFASIGGFLGGGLTGFRLLSSEPSTIALELNEWVRFDVPGKYRVRVTTRRVAEVTDERPVNLEGHALTANELEITVVPAEAEWQAETLRHSLATLDAAKSNTPKPSPGFPAGIPERSALKALRYLGTADAAREMARRIGRDEPDWEWMFGLIGSPQRDTGLAEMQRLLGDPDHPVNETFLRTMSVLSVSTGQSPEVAQLQRQERERALRERLLEAISSKRGRALAVSLDTVLPRTGRPEDALPPEKKRQLVEQLAKVFDLLPPERQADVLQYAWNTIKGPALLPLLRKQAEHYEDFPVPNEWSAHHSLQVSGTALQHWYELAPEEARPAVIREILRPRPRYGAQVLGILPEKTLPEVEQALVEHLAGSDNLDAPANLASLIARYATAGVLPQVLAVLDRNIGKWACVIQEPLLAYVLRVEPTTARSRIEAALAARGPGYSACNHTLLTEIAALQPDSMLEEIAIRSLDDPDPQIAADAALFLQQHGSPAAEEPLWRRYEAWSQQWRGRQSELRDIPGEPNTNLYQVGLAQCLAYALGTGQAWLADEGKLRRLVQLAVDSQGREEAERWLQAWLQRPWTIHYFASEPPQLSLLQWNLDSLEALKNKLAQFPKGSVFVWNSVVGAGASQSEKLFADLTKFLSERGMTLQKASPAQ